MKGYIQNISNLGMYALKRHVPSKGKVDLETLYLEYGQKHDIERGKPFVEWLRSIKLQNENVWKIVLEDDSPVEEKETVLEEKPKKETKPEEKIPATKDRAQSASPRPVAKGWDAREIANFTVSQAREEIPKVKDKRLLRQALSIAEQLHDKTTVCKLLKARIDILKQKTA